MTNAQSIRIAGKTALIAALMGGSSLAFAQDVAPVVAAPSTPEPVATVPAPAPVVVPPPVVSTLPRESDTVNAAAAQEAAAEAGERRGAAVTKRSTTAARTAVRPEPAPVRAPTSAVAPDPVESVEPVVPTTDSIAPAPSIVEEAPVATQAEGVNAQGESVSGEDLTLVGGIAAALAAIGIGAAFASRRKRKVVAYERQPKMDVHRDFVAPPPINQDPAFQQFAAQPASAPPTIAAPASERIIQPKPVITRPDIPVTDPLFSRTVVQTPITDPLFAPRNDVEIPITDPLFAKHGRFAGRPQSVAAQRETEMAN